MQTLCACRCVVYWAFMYCMNLLLLMLYMVNFHNQVFILLQVDELARVVINVCAIVPGGIVCFFCSHHY